VTAPPAPEIRFREATLDDCDRLGEQSAWAYPAPGDTPAKRAELYRACRVSPIETVTIAERDGEMVGSMRRIPYTGWIGGVASPVGGLASVAVAPEVRQTGIAAALIRRHLDELVERDIAWSFLYPFSPCFYAKHGWAAAASRLRWQLRPEAFPRAPERLPLRRLSIADAADRDLIQAAYERHCARTNGSLSRTAELFAWLHQGHYAVGVARKGGLAGYLIYSLRAPSPRPQTLVVQEWVAEDGVAERALFGFLGAQRDQVEEVLIDTSPDHPLAALIENGTPPVEDERMPDEHHPIATLGSGYMARAIDLAAAARTRGYPGAPARGGAVAISVTRDPLRAANVRTVTVAVTTGAESVAVEVTSGRAQGAPLVTGPIGAISAVLVGAVRLDDAARLGLVSVEGDLAAATALLALPPPAPLVTF
jgi:predicted acetyltransferase